MAHPVIDGPITVLKVVTPGSYWIKCGDCRGSAKVPETIRRKPYSGDFYPPNGAKVFVHDSDGFFYHGTVCGRGAFPIFASMQARKYTVQLTHTFQVKDFDRCHIYPTFDEDSVTCESAHLVSLFRVLPVFPPPDFLSSKESTNAESCQSFLDRIRNWEQSNSVVEDLVRKHRRFRYEQLAVINGSLYGKLSFFETAREINIKDAIATQRIAVRTMFRFESVVQSLMSRPLHNCFNLLPLYSQDVALVPPAIPEPHHNSSRRVDNFDLSKFRVYKEDIELHESLWTPTSVNILFTGLNTPGKGLIPVKYVAPDGQIVLGTVLSPKVFSYELCERERAPDDMLKRYIREQSFSSNPEPFSSCTYYAMNAHTQIMPPSSDEEDLISSHSADMGLFSYDFDEALRQFRHRGGLLEDYCPLSELASGSRAVVRSVEMSLEYLNVPTLEDWQLVCLPSMMSKKNVLVIGPESHRKMTTSIVSTLSLIRDSSTNTQQNGMGPIFVLLVDDYKRADQAAKLCRDLSNLVVIASTYSQISEAQKQETQKGCDILISTPGNWLKLTKDLKCFDCTRLSHVVFDSFEKLHKDYPSEIETIFKDIQSINHVQVIFLSNVWGPFLVDFVNLLDSTTRCVIDLLLACCCYRLEPTVVIVADDWDELLTSIIKNDRTTLRLLLCHDHLEVTAIKSRTIHLDSVLYAHENEDRQSVMEVINQWKSNNRKLLVTSDLLFSELDFVQNVNLLVSWKQNPCSRSTLIRRLMSIRGHATHERRKVQLYIFCGRNNLEELVFIKNVLENVKQPRFLGGDLDECIESAFKASENLKMGTHCPSFSMFGKCDLTPVCPCRHGFRQQDLIRFGQDNVFLQITSVKFHSAFHSTVRVEEIISNQETADTIMHSFSSNLSEIDAGLECAYESNLNGSPNAIVNMKVDDVVGALISKDNGTILRRVKIISIGEIIDCKDIEFEVLLMDFDEPHKTLFGKDLFPLPPRIVSYPRDIVDIFLSKLVPADFKSNWPFETKSFVNNFADLIEKTSNCHHKLLAGVVEVVIERSIIVKSIHWCRVEDPCTYVVDHSLREAVLASKYVKDNPEHLTVLSKLAEDCGKQPLIDVVEGEFGFRRKFPSGFNDAFVTAFDDPGVFYVQLCAEKEELEEFETRLTRSLNRCRRRLSVVDEDEMCCILIEGAWNRALILGKDDTKIVVDENDSISVTVLLVDYGDTRPVSARKLFCLPTEFLEGVPYFAIECELVGILPFEGNWSDAVVQEFERHIRDHDDRMTPVKVKSCGVVSENRYTKHFRHQVALQGLKDDENTVNQHLVSRGMAGWNQATVNFLVHRDREPRRETRRRNV